MHFLRNIVIITCNDFNSKYKIFIFFNIHMKKKHNNNNNNNIIKKLMCIKTNFRLI